MSMAERLERLIDDFIRGDGEGSCVPGLGCGCVEEFEPMRTLPDAIRIACRSITKTGKKHDHQRRIRPSALGALEATLRADEAEIAAAPDFDVLHSLVRCHCGRIWGLGPLVAYDVAQRIGEGFLGIAPDYIYLHAGTAKGARVFGVTGRRARIEDFPKPFSRLSPAQAEDFLCVYKDALAAIVRGYGPLMR